MLTSYPVVINHFSSTFDNDDIVAEAALRRFSQLPHQYTYNCSDALWTKALRMGEVYDEGHVKSLFIEGVFTNLSQYVRA